MSIHSTKVSRHPLPRLSTLVSAAEPGEAKTFFLKMQGDYYRPLDRDGDDADACCFFLLIVKQEQVQ